MTPLFNRIDLAPDAVFLLWFAVGMAAIGLVIGAYMVARRAWRWVGRRLVAKRRHVTYRDIEDFVDAVKNQPVYTGPVYWPAMDRLRKMWVEREERERDERETEAGI